jgi:enterochelin esterase family protein
MSTDTPLRDPLAFRGRVETRPFESECLRGNRAGDSHVHVREVPVYLPPQAVRGERCSVLFVLQSFSGKPQDFLDTHPWRLGVVARFDAAIDRGEVAPAILVMPDGFTRLGGSQYVDSEFNGPFERHIVEELVPWIDATYPTVRGRRGIVGKSSGGFGALHLAMRHPDVFPVAASISGDCHFEYCYGPDLLACLRGLVPFGGDPAAFLADFATNPSLDGDRHAVINILAMSAAYSPNPSAPLGFDLPMDLETGERVESVWKRWLEFDPVVACARYADNLRKLEFLHVECGLRDEFHLQWGLRVLVRKLRGLGVRVEHEEHPGSHRGISQRYDAVFPKLVAVLGKAGTR